jgi:hypothetical protein
MKQENEMKIEIVAEDEKRYQNLTQGMEMFTSHYSIFGQGSVIVSGPGMGQTIWIEPYITRVSMKGKSIIEKVEKKSSKKKSLEESSIINCDIKERNMSIGIKDLSGNSTFYLIFF